jgi:pyridoxamine 5'-phosphate oxidase
LLFHSDITVEPILRVVEILNKAMTLNLVDWNAMNIATVNVDGSPSSRMVLLKKVDDRGFVFYSNFNSRKGKEIETNNSVALNFWWRELKEQIRVEGKIERLSAEESDEYFNSRALQSRVAAIVSKQSEEIDSYEKLNQEIEEMTKNFKDKGEEPKRPEHCGLYLIVPSSIEIWKEGDYRTHLREKFTLTSKKTWESCFLSP